MSKEESNKKRKNILAIAKKLKEKTNTTKEKGFRVVLTGKGGAGKTTTTALLSLLFARKGFNVLAVDEDPQMNLPYAIGVPENEGEKIVPLTMNLGYIEEKIGVKPGVSWGGYLRLTPDVSDVVDRFYVKGPNGIKILVMGTVEQAATGCLCPENALLNAVVKHINLREREIILMDTQAGVEHFGRALSKGFKQAIIVTDFTFNSIQVAKHSFNLAKDIGIHYIHLVINKIYSEKNIKRAKDLFGSILGNFTEIIFVPYEESLLEYEPNIGLILNKIPPPPFVKKIEELQRIVEKYGLKS